MGERPDLAVAVVGVEVLADERRDRRAAVHVAADDGAVAAAVVEVEDRVDDGVPRSVLGGVPSGPAIMPSRRFHPKFAFLPYGCVALPKATKSTSSRALWPTSPIQRSPVVRSNEMRNGLRRPNDQISPRAVGTLTNGLSVGIVYDKLGPPAGGWDRPD